jgi:hypothetical protein
MSSIYAPRNHAEQGEHIREMAKEAVDQIMEQAQIFASTWSSVGGPFDDGSSLHDAYDAKDELLTRVRSLADLAAETVRPQQPAPAAQEPLTWLQFCKAMKDGFGAEEWDETLENAPEHDRAELTRVLRMIEAAHGITGAMTPKIPFPIHPEPRALQWSALERAAISKYGQACAMEAATKCAKLCADLEAPAELNNAVGCVYEIATLNCEWAIKAHFNLGATP